MLLAQGRAWRASWLKPSDAVSLDIVKGPPAEVSPELKELRIDVPLEKWGLVVKNVQTDRKLLGGVLLDFANHKERVAAAVGSDRMYLELQRVVVDATMALIEAGVVSLTEAKRTSD